MSIDPHDSQATAYSSDGRWWWDGQQWTPVARAYPAITPPTHETGRPAGSVVRGLALALGILAIAVGVVLWVFAGSVRATRTNDLIVTGLLLLGFVPGLLAVIFGLAPRPRTRLSTGAFTCGLVGFGVTFLWVAFTILNF
jgi:hypothetical protein